MAGRGFAPKSADKQLGHRTTAEKSTTAIAPTTRPAPALPGASDYSAATRRWYTTWAQSPQASQFTDTDWMRLHMLAPLVEQFFRAPTKEVMAEIRLNEAKLGATPEDRQRLHWKVGPEAAGDAPE